MKVKVISASHQSDLEKEVNEFLNGNSIDVIDIKLSESTYGEAWSITALVMYEEVK